MKRINTILLLSVLTFFTTQTFSRGLTGTYTVTGIAKTNDGQVLINRQVIVMFGNRADTLQTDNNGTYKYTVTWGYPCPSGRQSKLQLRRATKKMNPKYVYFSVDKSMVKFKNDFRRYRGSTVNKDILFKIT